ncbi:hypothetical protein [Helicobacter pylori]|uniref:hypothetical protein n=1 Tax=Helicobacter pylori TaxID=210 RepID=UPI002929481D|nr:hypothetical protein [Helicobacter pylori]MDU9805655.1 hypothetical protein [Helicobacter pylori]
MHSASRGCRCFSSGVLMSGCDRKVYNRGLFRCFNETIGRACSIKKRSLFHIGLIGWF